MKQFPPFRKNWANCCHILFEFTKKSGGLVSVADADEKWFSLFIRSYFWAVNVLVVDPNVLSLFSDMFHRWQDCLLHSGSQRLFLAGLSCLTVITEGVERFTPSCGQFSAVLTRVKRRPSSALWLVSSAVNHWYHPITPLYVTRFLWCVAFQRLRVVVVRLVLTSFDFTSNCNNNSLWPQWTQWNQQVVY